MGTTELQQHLGTLGHIGRLVFLGPVRNGSQARGPRGPRGPRGQGNVKRRDFVVCFLDFLLFAVEGPAGAPEDASETKTYCVDGLP